MVGGDSTGVAGIHEGFWTTEALELLLKMDDQRGKTSIEAHHQKLLASVGCFDGGELFSREAKGFLHENMFAGSESLLHQQRMTVMTGGDHQGVAT